MKPILRGISLALALAVIPTCTAVRLDRPVYAESAAITSMSYFSANDGPVISHSGVSDASYGFVMPVFNGGALSWEDASADLQINVKKNGEWIDIVDVGGFVYDYNWGHWHDGGVTGFWFKVSETTELRFSSKSDPTVHLDFTLNFEKLEECKVTSMIATQGPVLTADATGGTGFTFPTFNGDSAVTYEQVKDDLAVYIRTAGESKWTELFDNPASGWIYDKNFGIFTDGPGGFWFTVEDNTEVRLQSISKPDVTLYYTIAYTKPVRSSYTLTAAGDTSLKADTKGAVGIVLPNIDGGSPIASELAGYVYQVSVNGKWVDLDDPNSGFVYRSSGYSTSNPANQWGYWSDHVFGLWFQPITEDMKLRIGYPTDGVKGHDCGTNFITYTIAGEPSAPRPDPIESAPIQLGTADDDQLEGWELIWQDEFHSGIDSTSWTHETGYFIGDDPYTWGWGNNELEHYTDSEKNSFVADDKLTIRLIDEPATFEPDPSKVALYSSGKLVTKDKFSFKYGRIDFCAKLPTGNGIWPALWLLPNDSVYGTWAASGEIDVMESKGRIPDTVYGTVHYGGEWPTNVHSGSTYHFDEGNYADGFHVYSCIWEQEKIRMYVDGQCYMVIPYTEWYSAAAKNDPYAPFDQEFYVIMNLAAGGNFDGGLAPGKNDVPSEMQVEYVRVYQQPGDTTCSYTRNGGDSNVAYLVRLQRWLLGRSVDGKDLDFDKDGVIDTFDLVKARKELVNRK